MTIARPLVAKKCKKSGKTGQNDHNFCCRPSWIAAGPHLGPKMLEMYEETRNLPFCTLRTLEISTCPHAKHPYTFHRLVAIFHGGHLEFGQNFSKMLFHQKHLRTDQCKPPDYSCRSSGLRKAHVANQVPGRLHDHVEGGRNPGLAAGNGGNGERRVFSSPPAG